MIRLKKLLVILLLLIGLTNCTEQNTQQSDAPLGKLYIIGGGKRPASVISEIIQLSALDKGGYGIILPMSSSEPDTAFYYGKKQFSEQGIDQVFNFNIRNARNVSSARIDSIVNARLIYITGGDQSKFMDVVLNSPVHKAIRNAYVKGSVIAGTSAGAAVMSKKMITGNEYKHPEYTGDFRTIEAENMEIREGLGLLENAIIDQHFIWRMRMNRLITVAIENPGYTCIGIDESTAIVVSRDTARVSGISQVIVIRNDNEAYKIRDGLLGAGGMELNVFLPGDSFKIK